jgi:RNA polymerase sigma-32 factor
MAAAHFPREFSPDRNLTSYLQKIRAYPLLSQAEEVALARRFRRNGDRAAADALVTSHLRLVAKIAMGYRGYGLPVADLIAEGSVGLLQAVRGFDPERGFRFSTYALWWIRAAIQEYVLHTWSLVKIGTTAAQKKLFFNLRRIKGEIEAIAGGDLEPEQVARIALELDVSGDEIVHMNRRLAHTDDSLNTPMYDEGGGEWLDRLADDRASQESVVADEQEWDRRRGFLCVALDRLTPREKHILTERRLKETPTTLQSLSDRYRISRERIRQIEIRAFEKIRKFAPAGAGASGVQL